MNSRPEPVCEPLPWDSEHFGLAIAEVAGGTLGEERAAAADEWCEERGIDCLYLLAAAEDAESSRVAARHGYRAVDVRLGFRHDLERLGERPWHSPGGDEVRRDSPGTIEVRRASEHDLEALRPLARSSHRTTRFYFDGRFAADRCDELYVRWIERAVADRGRELLVMVADGEPVGYQALRLPGPEPARLELIALDPVRRGRGLGRALLLSALRLLRDRGAPSVATATQARNVGPVRAHERVGFLLESAGVWHHKWFRAP